jgi:hypothetical protein
MASYTQAGQAGIEDLLYRFAVSFQFKSMAFLPEPASGPEGRSYEPEAIIFNIAMA